MILKKEDLNGPVAIEQGTSFTKLEVKENQSLTMEVYVQHGLANSNRYSLDLSP